MSASEEAYMKVAYVDSGANVNVISQSVLNQLRELTKKEFPLEINSVPAVIQWGSSQIQSTSIHHVILGGAVGKALVVADASATLISVFLLAQGGYIVVFTDTVVLIISKDAEQVISVGFVDTVTHLYAIDLVQLVNLEVNQSISQQQHQPSFLRFIQSHSKQSQKHQVFSAEALMDAVLDAEATVPLATVDDEVIDIELPDISAGDVSPATRAKRVRLSQCTERIEIWKVKYVRELHVIMNHIPLSTIALAVRNNVWSGVPTWMTASIIESIASKFCCIVCELNKRNKLPQQLGSGVYQCIIGHSLSIDVQGPYSPTTTYGCRYRFLVVELATGYLQSFLAFKKTQLIEITRAAIGFMRRHGHITRTIRCDAGSVENSVAFETLSNELQFTISPSPPLDQSSNPVERHVQTSNKNMLATLLGQNTLGPAHWGSASFSTCDSMNDRPNSLSQRMHGGDQSPRELVTGIKPDISKCKFPFGKIVTWPRTSKVSSFESPNAYGVAVGRTNEATLVVSPDQLVPRVRKYCRPFNINVQSPNEATLIQLFNQNIVSPDGSIQLVTSGKTIDNLKKILFESPDGQDDLAYTEDDPELLSGWLRDGSRNTDSPTAVPLAPPLRRSSRQAEFHRVHVAVERANMTDAGWFRQLHVDDDDGDDEDYSHSIEAAITRQFQSNQPTNLSIVFKARKLHTLDNPTQRMIDNDPELQLLWNGPATAEFSQFVLDKVMVEVDYKDIPYGCRVLQVRPIYKIKYKPSGEIDKYKCRLPIDGSPELRDDTFPDPQVNYTPTLRQQTFILMFAIAVLLGYKKFVVDITGCFLQNQFPTHRQGRVFVQFPDSFTGGHRKYFMMLVAAYGLADASRIWFDIIIPLLESIGFIQSIWDPCCLVLAEEGGRLIVGITTDDFFCIVTDTAVGVLLKQRMFDMLDDKFPGTNSKRGYTVQDPMISVIGYHLTVNEDGSETLTQPHTIDSIMSTFFPEGIPDDLRYESTQMPLTWNEDDLDNSAPFDCTQWLHSLGVIIFLMRTRYDIVQAISKHSSRTHYCTDKDYKALQHLARYIYHTRDMGLTFHPDRLNEFEEALQFCASADAAFLVYKRDSKSQLSNNIKLASSMDSPSAMIQVTSQKESDAPSSSAVVAEAKAAFDVVKSLIVAEGLAHEITGLPIVRPTVIEEDSSGAIRACQDYCRQTSSRKMRHETLKFHALMHHIKEGLIKFRQVPSAHQTSDAGTKQQRPTQHWKCLPTIMGHSEAIFKGQDEAVRRRKSLNAEEIYSTIHRVYSGVDRSVDFADVLAQAAAANMGTARDPAITVNFNTRTNAAICTEGTKLRDQNQLFQRGQQQHG